MNIHVADTISHIAKFCNVGDYKNLVLVNKLFWSVFQQLIYNTHYISI